MAQNQPEPPFKWLENLAYRGGIVIVIVLIITWLFLSVLKAMSDTFSPMAVGIAIGIMIGAVLMHFYHVRRITP